MEIKVQNMILNEYEVVEEMVRTSTIPQYYSNVDILINRLYRYFYEGDKVNAIDLLKQIPKKTKSKIYGFINEFFYPYTYMSHCDYVYNQGKVYNICFHLSDGTTVESYFGWLYREKEKTVNKVEKKLLKFIEKINMLCKENRKNK